MFVSFIATVALVSAGAFARTVAPSACTFHKAAAHWEGTCGKLFDQIPKLTLAPAKAIATGRWKSDVTPTAVWAGDMTDEGSPNADIEIELYKGDTGIMRTEYGWFPVTKFAVTASILSFSVDTLKPIPPSELDRDIVKRANTLLSSVAVWNRADNRQCPATATTWSIYCAMQRAAIEVTGGAHHRRPAMELVRLEIERRSIGRNYEHRLMDYNNDTTTTLADVRSLFNEVLARKYYALNGEAAAEATIVVALQTGAASGAAATEAATATVTATDLKIIQRTSEILASRESWNQTDKQDCASNAKSFGLYCALKKASEDVTGSFNHDGAVMDQVREAVDFAARKKYSARLVDYNNDHETTLADVQALLRMVQNRINRQLNP